MSAGCLGCLPCGGSSASLGTPGQLEEPWRRLLVNGEIFAALVLSTLFSEKYKGRNMKVGETAEIRLPALPGAEPKVWRPTLLHRAGGKEVCAFIWRGDDSSPFPTIFVAFSPLRSTKQFCKILFSSKQTMREVAAVREEPTFMALAYVQKKLKNLWEKYDFQAKLDDTLAKYPSHLVLCCGLSHGATLAQATAMKSSLIYPEKSINAVTWNAYKFLDETGVAMFKEAVGKRLLPLTISQGKTWDSIAGAPRDFAPVPRIVLLDADTGDFRPAKDIKRTTLGPCSLWRAYRLHFAKQALKATRMAMTAALAAASGDPANKDSGLRQLRTLRWPTRHSLRSWSYGPGDAWSPLTEQENELGRYERQSVSEDECDDRGS